MKKGIYAGSFDPITLGHLHVIEKGSKLFDHLTILLADNPAKKCMFSKEERITMISSSLENLKLSNIDIQILDNKYAAQWAIENNYNYFLRGIRNSTDFEYEFAINQVNLDISDNQIETIYIIPPKKLSEISSSLVKGLIGPEGWENIIKNYIPNFVYFFILKKKILEWRDNLFYTHNKEIEIEALNKYDRYYNGYHNIEHIYKMIKKLIELKSYIFTLCTSSFEFYLAIIYHDLIYDTNQTDKLNVELSEKAFIEDCMPILENKKIDLIANLINLTKHDRLPITNSEKLMLNLDLMILSSSKKEYNEYKNGIRNEYSQYPDSLFYPQRLMVLKKIMDSQIYYPLEENDEWVSRELIAKLNLAAEIEEIKLRINHS